jgi:pectinesterase
MRTRRHILQTGLSASALGLVTPALAHSDPVLAALPKTIDAYVGDITDFQRSDLYLNKGLSSAKAYTTLSDAILNAPAGDERYTVLVGKGIFREKLNISRNNVTLYGSGCAKSLIVWNDYADKPDGKGATLGTFNSQTVAITAKGARLISMTIANDFDYNHYVTLQDTDPAAIKAKQAVALKISAPADETFLFDLNLTGFQDTLYINSGRSWINYCDISGCVDFIFGAGTAFIERCQIISRLIPGQGMDQGFIAAPSTLKTTKYGFVFSKCSLICEPGHSFPPRSVALARPWRPTTTYSDGRYGNPDAIGAAIFTQCQFGGHITDDGFTHMGYNQKDGQRGFVDPHDVRFFVTRCDGPSASQIAKAYPFPASQIADLTVEPLLGLSGWKAR